MPDVIPFTPPPSTPTGSPASIAPAATPTPPTPTAITPQVPSPPPTGEGYLASANNLSDLQSAEGAKVNLGLDIFRTRILVEPTIGTDGTAGQWYIDAEQILFVSPVDSKWKSTPIFNS